MKERVRKGLHFLICLQLLCVPGTLPAQVRELWRTGLTNSFIPFAAYRLRTAVIDQGANTIVGGGIATSLADSVSSGFVAKFDSQGNKVWEVQTGANAFNGIDALEVDSDGNIFVTTRLDPFSEERTLVLMKLSPEGKELWRAVEHSVMQTSDSYGIGSALKVDAAGNPAVTTILISDLSSNTRVSQQLVTKFDGAGRNLWRTMLPGYGYFLYQASASRPLAVNESGGVTIGGMYSGAPLLSNVSIRGFLATLDENGRLEWWTDDYKGDEQPAYYPSVLVNSKGIIGAAALGEGAFFFSQRGRALHTVPDGDRVLHVTPQGGFLVYGRGYLFAVNSTGNHEQWRFAPRFSGLWDAVADGVADGTSGWIMAGAASLLASGVGFAKIDGDGNELWRAEFPYYGLEHDPNEYLFQNVFLRARDGTLRVVGALSGSFPLYARGITVAAFVSP